MTHFLPRLLQSVGGGHVHTYRRDQEVEQHRPTEQGLKPKQLPGQTAAQELALPLAGGDAPAVPAAAAVGTTSGQHAAQHPAPAAAAACRCLKKRIVSAAVAAAAAGLAAAIGAPAVAALPGQLLRRPRCCCRPGCLLALHLQLLPAAAAAAVLRVPQPRPPRLLLVHTPFALCSSSAAPVERAAVLELTRHPPPQLPPRHLQRQPRRAARCQPQLRRLPQPPGQGRAAGRPLSWRDTARPPGFRSAGSDVRSPESAYKNQEGAGGGQAGWVGRVAQPARQLAVQRSCKHPHIAQHTQHSGATLSVQRSTTAPHSVAARHTCGEAGATAHSSRGPTRPSTWVAGQPAFASQAAAAAPSARGGASRRASTLHTSPSCGQGAGMGGVGGRGVW